ncbi:uncharacterized protein LOC133838773 [Drosophila sulfurigaster albostrigata]|uniref:uncharacterized protein LOC133838773 n=1 Tax=Drosophila sulfurigaster albostrigata TaxID=89887 RepID=UPI002D21919C|nr:uncharacterized protein LOC133838773 [Drosophila sulfurigaster albostrigata]
MKLMDKLSNWTLMDFTESIVSETNLLNRDFKVAFYLMVHGHTHKYINKDLLSHFVNLQKLAIDRGYPQEQSPQQHIYSMYMDIALTELKAYILLEYAQLILRVSGKSNLIVDGRRIRANYKANTEHGFNLLRNLSQQADRVLWRSDPESEKHLFNVTYDEVTRLLQGYVENEVDLNNEGSCSRTCYAYQNTTSMSCFDQKFCSQQPQCEGRIYECQFVDSDLSVCQSPTSSNRRYEYIQYGDGQLLGKYDYCQQDANKVESWRRWLFWQCSYCFCLCDEPGPKSDRFFNLRETLSDVQANKVVTGVRFVKKNRVFQLQIQQGQLLPRGAINESTLEWKPVDDYEIYDSTIKVGVDYHTLSYQSRAVDLDEVTKTDDATFVVTGVRFQVIDGHLNLKVRFSKFDFLKGEIVDPQVNSVWQAKDDIPNREKLNIDNLDVPTRSLDKSKVLSGDNQYLEFVNTGMNKDAAQTTIPFIDLQNAASNQPVPLAGIGLYYKGSYGYGGFVALKIITFDILPYLPLPETITKS